MSAQGTLSEASDSPPTGPQVCVANGFVQLVAHVLAHVPLDAPGNLFDPRYRSWAAQRQAARERELLDHDAALIAKIWAAEPRADALHWMFALHDGLDSFRASAGLPLAQLDPAHVAQAAMLARLRELPVAELLHTTLALLEPSCAQIFEVLDAHAEHTCKAVAAAAAPLARALPSFAAVNIELVWAFGRSGRALAQRVLVGAPAPWNVCSPARQAVLAAHEHCVASCPAHAYVEAEWHALRTLAQAMTSLAHTPSREAHARWLAELDLRELLAALVHAGALPRADALHIRDEPHARAALIAAAASP